MKIEDIRKWFEKKIVDGVQYSGNLEPKRKVLSGSMLTIDPIRFKLQYKYGYISQNEIGQNTLGSVFQHGIDNIFKKITYVDSAVRYKKNLGDWTLSGEIDQLLSTDNVIAIIDNKLIKKTTYEKLKKEDWSHEYALQVRFYKYLLPKTDKDIKMYISLWFKDGTVFGRNIIPNWELYEIKDNWVSDEEFEEKIIEPKIRELEEAIATPIEDLPQCNNLLWNNRRGKSRPEKCISFCEYNDKCPHYNKYVRGSGYKAINDLLKKL